MKKLLTIILISSSFVFAQSGWGVYGGFITNSFEVEDKSLSYESDNSFNIGISKQLGEIVTIGTGLHHRGGYVTDVNNDKVKIDGHVFELWSTWRLLTMDNGANVWFGPSIAFKADLDAKLNGDNIGDLKMEDTDLSVLLGFTVPMGDRNAIHLVFQESLKGVQLSSGNQDWESVMFSQIYLNFSRAL